MRARPIYGAFNAGELSPLLSGRPDLEKYRAGLSLCENFIPRVQGALQRRGGSRFVREIRDSAKRAWLVDFVYAASDSFVLEFGDRYVRFYRDRAAWNPGGFPAYSAFTAYVVGDVVTSGGSNWWCKAAVSGVTPGANPAFWYQMPAGVFEIPTPWALADLTDADGAFALKYVQSGDVLYLAHPGYAPRKLSRRSNLQWALELLTPAGGPFKDQNTDRGVTVSASGTLTEGGTVILTASAAIFAAGHVGSLFYLEMADGCDVKPWAPGQRVALNDKRSSDGKYYQCTEVPSGTVQTAGNKPIHTWGAVWDGEGVDRPGDASGIKYGVEWTFLHPGYGWVQITGVSSGTVATAKVLSRLPDVLTANPSWRWAHGSWSDVEGWPADVCFFRERLVFARARQLYFSVAGDFENFRAKEFGITDLSSAMVVDIQSGRGDPIRWLAPAARLIVGTGGGEAAIGEQTSNQAFGPGNAKADLQGEWGARGVAPLGVGGSVIYVEKSGRALRELAYDFNADGWTSVDLTRFSEHLFARGIVDTAFARQPHELVWTVRDDGALLAFTFNKTEGVAGWHRHPIGGGGAVEAVTVVPAPDGSRDDVWLIVRRTVQGVARRYVEWLTPEWREGDDQALFTTCDASTIYSGAPTTTLGGLGWLEGCTVALKLDGAAHPDRTVTAGSVALDRPASKVVAGLRAPARASLMPLDDGAAEGSAQGRSKRVHRVTARLWNSFGGRFGPDFSVTEPVAYPAAAGAAPALFTGDRVIEFPGDHDGRAGVAIECDQDFPFTLVALMPELVTHEG